MKVVIIGGVAGGATVAARLRRLDEKAEIVLFEEGEFISYANCGIPYYIGDVIEDRDDLFVQTVASFTQRFRVDVRVRQRATAIHPVERLVDVHNISTGEVYSESYDRLVLSPGAEPVKPAIPGIDGQRIFRLRNVKDTDAVKGFISEKKPRRAVIVGGGFIGLEMAENLHRLGIGVTIVEKANQVMAPLDYSMAAIVHQHLKEQGVKILLEDGVARFEENEAGITLHLQSGKRITADMVLLCIGVKPDIHLAREAGLAIGALGGIKVDSSMQTSDPHIYALGDAVEVVNPVTGKAALIPLAGPANKQARIVATNIALGVGAESDCMQFYAGTVGNAIAKVFDLTVASAGLNAKQLRQEGIPYLASFTHSASHADYYPGSTPLSVKILFSPKDGQLLGAQIVGRNGVDKRIDLPAQVIRRKGSIHELSEIEQAYAPPYSSAKDPVNIAGYVAENILKGLVKIIHWNEVSQLDDTVLKVDVRTKGEYRAGTIAGALNIPLDELRERLDELPKDRPIMVFCGVGLRAYLAYRILVQNGFTDVRNLSGGYRTYFISSNPV